MLKYEKLSLIRNPKTIFKSGRTIRWQFDMYHTFFAERFLPYWFKKYTKFLEWPVIFYDINK